MTEPRELCPKCHSPVVWNGTGMACVACPYVTPAPRQKPKSEKKLPTPRKRDK